MNFHKYLQQAMASPCSTGRLGSGRRWRRLLSFEQGLPPSGPTWKGIFKLLQAQRSNI